MPSLGPTKRVDLIRFLRQLDFVGPQSGGKHEFMLKGKLRLALPNPHRSDISKGLLTRLLRQAGITQKEWEAL
jgi:predicted RNA binding protein YcfA (HicA-like mRNA interferase family)